MIDKILCLKYVIKSPKFVAKHDFGLECLLKLDYVVLAGKVSRETHKFWAQGGAPRPNSWAP